MKKMPESFLDAVFTIFRNLRFNGQDTGADELALIHIENAPAIDRDQHRENISRLASLKKIVPDTSADIITTAEFGIALFSCPVCHTVHTNIDALANMQSIQEAQQSPIIMPKSSQQQVDIAKKAAGIS